MMTEIYDDDEMATLYWLVEGIDRAVDRLTPMAKTIASYQVIIDHLKRARREAREHIGCLRLVEYADDD